MDGFVVGKGKLYVTDWNYEHIEMVDIDWDRWMDWDGLEL